MIKNELRIGVWINYFEEATFIPNETHLSQIIEYLSQGFIEGIPLTEEWLERLGLDNGSISHSYHTEMRVEKYTTAAQGWLNNAWRVVLMDSVPHHLGRQFKYVHEIQNLFFALTGEELTIK